MLRTRVIPTLLLRNDSLVKTRQFGKFTYVGDPCNTVRIFNELEVDELLVLDIMATREGRPPNFELLAEMANECFMPVAYGGGVPSIQDAKTIFKVGIEKVVINSYAAENSGFIAEMAKQFGSQAVVVSIDVKKNVWGTNHVLTNAGQNNIGRDPVDWAKEVESLGAGEIILTSIDREGSWEGFDIDLIKSVASVVDVPVIAHGGAGSVKHIGDVVGVAGASAVGLGSMVVFQKKGMGVLVNFPDKKELEGILE